MPLHQKQIRTLHLHLLLFHRPGSVVANFMVFYGTPPGDITDPNMIEAEVENFVSSYLQFLISLGNLGSYPIVPGPVPPVMVQGRQLFSIILIMLFTAVLAVNLHYQSTKHSTLSRNSLYLSLQIKS